MNEINQTILIVEDEAQIRKFLRISLEAHGFRVEESRIGEEGLQLCATLYPHLVILDLGLPDIDGQEFIQRLREWSQVPVIVLSVRESESEKVMALDAGANDYVTKPFRIGELMARIRAVLRTREEVKTEPGELSSQGLHVSLVRHEVSMDGMPIHLSKKEYALLRLLMTSRGQVLTHQQILRQIWDAANVDNIHYLRVLVGQLRQKLGDDPANPRFIITLQGVGYRFAMEDG